MQMIHNGSHPGKSSVNFLPMIDMNSSDPSCIYSTLQFVATHASNHNSYPIITFDQPLWWKAFLIVLQEPEGSPLKSIVVRLGGFHTEMSFLGAVGHLMSGSGLEQVIETVYAGVEHILSGKAISRAVRAHLLVDRVLTGLILTNILNIEIENGGEEIGKDSNNNECQQNYCAQSVSHLERLLEKLLTNDISKSEIVQSYVLQDLEYKYFDKIENLNNQEQENYGFSTGP